jgi:beta-mannosidase
MRSISQSSFPLRRRIECAWQLARLSTADGVPNPSDWIPATVPGAVQLDWARAHELPELNFGQNFHAYDGLEDSYWLYSTTIPSVPRSPENPLFFTCGGVDYSCQVRIGGALILSHSGMVSPFDIDVSHAEAGAELQVLVFPAPKRHGAPDDRSQVNQVTKPAVSYGWDWHPRLIPLGICDETGFELRRQAHIRHVDFAYALAEDFSEAEITVTVEATHASCGFRWRLRNREGDAVLESDSPMARLRSPRLWWTHDHGEPCLYVLEVDLDGGDRFRGHVGFRRVRLVMHEGAWDTSSSFPVSRNLPPIALELNGLVIFAKGSNWVCPDIFHGRVDAETYCPLLGLARDAHFNLLRCWGGAAAPKEAFFDGCDALGLLAWQEFPLACNLYPDDATYLALLDQESRALIRRVRQHPCLGIWSGGNELFNAWSRMTDQSLPLRLLNRNCFDLDPQTPFLPTAPLEGMGHGDYRFRDEKGRDIFEIFQAARNTAYTEFGCPGLAPIESLRATIPADELWPPRPNTSWQAHHAFGAWESEAATWLCLPTIEHYFGHAGSLEELVAQSSLLQGEGYKSVFEEARRQQPRCSMALNWCFNEPWPAAANNSIISWPAVPKPGYFEVRAACRPVLASARIPHFQWAGGDEFSAELWMLNDSDDASPAGEIEAFILFGSRRQEMGSWTFANVGKGRNLRGPLLRALLPTDRPGLFQLRLHVKGRPDLDSTYSCILGKPDSAAGA